jgi:hypothetical protein
VVTFDKPPTDEELQAFVDPEGASPYVGLEDDGITLTGRPKPFPMWFVWVSLLVPAAGMYAALAWEWSHNNDPLFRVMALFTAIIWVPLSVITCAIIFEMIIKGEIRHDDFLVLDRVAGTLTLPRVGVTLSKGDVVELVQVSANHWVKHDDGWSGQYIHELSLLTLRPDGVLIRYQVIASLHAKPVRRVAAELAALFGVPRRKLRKPVLFGRWRRED